jgi:hypothetical protein
MGSFLLLRQLTKIKTADITWEKMQNAGYDL